MALSLADPFTFDLAATTISSPAARPIVLSAELGASAFTGDDDAGVGDVVLLDSLDSIAGTGVATVGAAGVVAVLTSADFGSTRHLWFALFAAH